MGSGSARILDGPVFSNETAAVEDCTVGVARRGVAAFTQFDNDGASERTRAGIARRRSVDVDVPDSTRIPERTRVVRQDPGSRFRMEHNHWIHPLEPGRQPRDHGRLLCERARPIPGGRTGAYGRIGDRIGGKIPDARAGIIACLYGCLRSAANRFRRMLLMLRRLEVRVLYRPEGDEGSATTQGLPPRARSEGSAVQTCEWMDKLLQRVSVRQ